MSVTINLPSVLARHAGGERALTADGATVAEVLKVLEARHPELGARLREASGDQSPFVTIYLNDEDIRFAGGLAAPVNEGDEVTVVPAIAGG
jgi:molybdopterin converting factor small subunit